MEYGLAVHQISSNFYKIPEANLNKFFIFTKLKQVFDTTYKNF